MSQNRASGEIGFSYTSITLKGAEQAPLVDYLRQLNREAYVSPTTNGITVIYDREGEDQNTAVAEGLAAQLSQRFNAPALAALVHDVMLWYCLYAERRGLDGYNSASGPYPTRSSLTSSFTVNTLRWFQISSKYLRTNSSLREVTSTG